MDFVVRILQRTPLWVWPLFAFLLYRGYAALKTRSQTQMQLFLLPAFLSMWGIISIWKETGSLFALAFFGGGVLVGFCTGWTAWRSGTYNRETDLFERKGTPHTLILVILIFFFKYITSVMVALHLEATKGLLFLLLNGGVSGFFCGLFWGGTGWLLAQKYTPRV